MISLYWTTGHLGDCAWEGDLGSSCMESKVLGSLQKVAYLSWQVTENSQITRDYRG